MPRVKFARSMVRGLIWIVPLIAIFAIIIHAAKLVEPKGVDQQVDQIASIVKGDVDTVVMSEFDPNSATYIELRELGVPKRVAASIIKYRESGKVFKIKEDLAICYGMTDSLYLTLEPWIVIADRYRAKPKVVVEYKPSSRKIPEKREEKREEKRSPVELFEFDPNIVTKEQFVRLGFSDKQWGVFENYRSSLGCIESVDQFARCYVVSESKMEELAPYINIADVEVCLLEVNGATMAELDSLSGIGAITSQRICEYRDKLGGFYKIEQICEVEGVVERNFEKFFKQIWADSCEIKKIDINFAPANILKDQLLDHPYGGRIVVRKILKYRQLKGGWSTIGDMINDDILSVDQAEKLAHYLLFRALTQQNLNQ